jgi:hypothetical protein
MLEKFISGHGVSRPWLFYFLICHEPMPFWVLDPWQWSPNSMEEPG